MTGGGENMWAASDAFHFAWKRAKGDQALSAEISFANVSGDPHKKAVLMFRQSLATDAAYASAALHNDGLTSLQARSENGARTHEIQSNTSGPTRLRLEKRGDMFYLFVAKAGADFQFSGGAFRVALQEPFYVGIGVCAHKKDTLETATFSKIELEPIAGARARLRSTLETITVTSTDRRAMAVSVKRANGPDWSASGQFDFPAKSHGRVASEILSPDGRRAVYLSLPNGKKSRLVQMFLVNTEGNRAPVFLAEFIGDKKSLGKSPWSPDSRRLVFVSYQFLP